MPNPKMKLVNLISSLDNLEAVMEKFVTFPCFEPVLAEKIVDTVHGTSQHMTQDEITPLLNTLENIEKEFQTEIEGASIEKVTDSYASMKEEVDKVYKQLTDFVSEKKMLNELLKKYQDALVQVKYISTLDVSLDDVFSCEYIVARVGKLPIDSVDKLQYYTSKPFIFKSFKEDAKVSWCMIFTTNAFEREVDNIFSSLLFERIYIPDFVHGTPEEAIKYLSEEIETTESQIKRVDSDTSNLIDEHLDKLRQMKGELALLEKVHNSEKYVVELGTRFYITGFIEAKNVPYFEALFTDIQGVEVMVRPSDSDRRLKSPKKIDKKACK